jgi:hypothetical protein
LTQVATRQRWLQVRHGQQALPGARRCASVNPNRLVLEHLPQT